MGLMGWPVFFHAVVIVFFSAVFLFVYDALTQWDKFSIQQIRVSGNTVLTESQIIRLAGISEGDNILSINRSLLQKKILTNPWVIGVSVSRDFPSTMDISVSEHRALAILDIGRRFIVNGYGDIFKEWEPSDPSDFPVISGVKRSQIPLSGNISQSPVISKALKILKMSRDTEAVLPFSEISGIDVDVDLGITVSARKGYAKVNEGRLPVAEIKLGHDDFESKLNQLRKILDFLATAHEVSSIKMIDISDMNRIVFSVSDHDPAGGTGIIAQSGFLKEVSVADK